MCLVYVLTIWIGDFKIPKKWGVHIWLFGLFALNFRLGVRPVVSVDTIYRVGNLFSF